jgi:hypothetical protein
VLNPLQKAAAAMRARLSTKQVKKMPEDLLKEVKQRGGAQQQQQVSEVADERLEEEKEA